MKMHGLLVLAVVSLFLVAESATFVQAQRGGFGRGGFGRGGGGLAGLLRVDEVADELELSDDQKQQVQAAMEELRGDRGDRGDRPSFRDMSDEEREAAIAEMRERAAERAKTEREKLSEILMDDQLERLEQISIQAQGIGALMNATVAEKLGLSEDAKKELQDGLRESMTAIRDRMREDGMRELFQSGDREAMREKMQEIRKEIEDKVLGTLSDSQKETFEKLKGKPFDMPQRSFGGPGGRGGGRRGGGDRPQRPE